MAAALGARTIAPRASLGVFVAAAFGLDLLWPIFLLTGLERVRIEPGNTAFTPLAFDHYPWSHSLLMAVVWALIAGACAPTQANAARTRLVIGLTVLSHWVLDFVTHRPDLPLWPEGPRLGLGLWNSVPGTLIVEGALFLVAIVLYARVVPARDAVGVWSLWSLVVFTGAIWMSGPWGPPPPSVSALTVAALALFLLPIWGSWIERHRGRQWASRIDDESMDA